MKLKEQTKLTEKLIKKNEQLTNSNLNLQEQLNEHILIQTQAKTKLENNLLLNQLFQRSQHVRDKNMISQSQPELSPLGKEFKPLRCKSTSKERMPDHLPTPRGDGHLTTPREHPSLPVNEVDSSFDQPFQFQTNQNFFVFSGNQTNEAT